MTTPLLIWSALVFFGASGLLSPSVALGCNRRCRCGRYSVWAKYDLFRRNNQKSVALGFWLGIIVPKSVMTSEEKIIFRGRYGQFIR